MDGDGSQASVTLRASRRGLVLLGLLLLGPWVILLVLAWPRDASPQGRELSAEPRPSARARVSRPGPWGDLREVRILTEPPAEAVVDDLNCPSPVWWFKGLSTNDFEGLLRAARLSPAQQQTLHGVSEWLPDGGGVKVRPPDPLVWDLSSESRSVLYAALSPFRENVFQREPFRFRADLAADWFINSGVAEPVIAQVQRLGYTRGRAVLFSDPHLVLPRLSSDLDRVRLLKTLCRQSTLIMYVHVSPESNIGSLLAYWAARPGLAKDIAPLLESASRVPGGCDIDVVHLLPRFVRKRLYTYPSREATDREILFDCHWTSLNFWNDPPDDRFNDPEFVLRTLTTEYEPVLDRYRLGDVILFMQSEREAVHSAVYVADDIVFTKNGPSPRSPWILMALDTLLSHYETSADVVIRAYRPKGGS